MSDLHSLSTKVLVDAGWRVATVERWLPKTTRRVDFYGFGDLFAFDATREMIVQVTSYDNMGARRKKIDEIPEAHEWINKESRLLVVHGWKKVRDQWMIAVSELTRDGWR